MEQKKIKVGGLYETTHGIGRCEKSGGTHQPSVRVRITLPIPRGLVNLRPRDVLREIEPPDQTDKDPTWCTVPVPGVLDVLHDKQCEHDDHGGRYVVEPVVPGEPWRGFDPPTKLQAQAWANRRPEREARIRWLCFECMTVMPLSDQLPKRYDPRGTCPGCGGKALDGKVTCGDVACGSSTGQWRRSQRTKNNTAKISSEIMSVWRRHGAGEAWQTALLWSCGDRAKAARLVSDLDAHAHVRDGILSYGGLSLQDVTEVEPPA